MSNFQSGLEFGEHQDTVIANKNNKAYHTKEVWRQKQQLFWRWFLFSLSIIIKRQWFQKLRYVSEKIMIMSFPIPYSKFWHDLIIEE